MTKIMTFCEDAKDSSEAFELGRREIALLAPNARLQTGEILGLYAFQCVGCGGIHVRTAGQDTIEKLVLLCGVVPRAIDIRSLPEASEEAAIALARITLTPAENIVEALTEEDRSGELVYV